MVMLDQPTIRFSLTTKIMITIFFFNTILVAPVKQNKNLQKVEEVSIEKMLMVKRKRLGLVTTSMLIT